MGTLTSNRKRVDESLASNHQSPYRDFPISKRPRFSYMQRTPNQTLISSNSTVSRISRYPESKRPLRREVHAPCRTLKFVFSNKSNQESASKGASGDQELGPNMGNILSYHLNKAKRRAFDAIRYLRKEKEVIDLDNEEEDKELKLDDSSVEEVEANGHGRVPRRSIISKQQSQDIGHEDEKLKVDFMDIDGKVEQRNENNNNFQPSSSSVVTEANNGFGDVVDIVRMDNSGKVLDSLSLNQGILHSVDVYKKLFESAQKRGSRLNAIGFEIELNEKRWAGLKSLRPVKQPEEKPAQEAPHEPFIPLTEEEVAEVERAFYANRRAVLVTHLETGIDITGHFLQCLRPGTWLNDEVINVYLGLLKEREKREPQNFLKCHFFNTFFYGKLTKGNKGYDYKAVKRWTTMRKLGYSLIECDKIFVPIHKEIHWCLAVINKKDQKFQYLDSLGGKDSKVLKDLARYFVEEVKDKNGKDIDVSDWSMEFVEDLPEQENGYDCGMFMLKYIDFYSRGRGLCFNQSHMPYFRIRTAKEILRLRAD